MVVLDIIRRQGILKQHYATFQVVYTLTKRLRDKCGKTHMGLLTFYKYPIKVPAFWLDVCPHKTVACPETHS